MRCEVLFLGLDEAAAAIVEGNKDDVRDFS